MKNPRLIQLLNVDGDPIGLYFVSADHMSISDAKNIIENAFETEYQREENSDLKEDEDENIQSRVDTILEEKFGIIRMFAEEVSTDRI
jgi:hypothetical protein